MLKTVLKLSLVSVLLIAAQACSLGTAAPATPNPGAVNTAIAQTMTVLTQTAPVGVPITGGESSTPAIITPTPTTALSPTPAFTATASGPQVSVYVATNCRTGPSIAYPRVGGLQVGQVAQVVGRNANNTYWIIQNPDRAGQSCWLWGQFATVIGNTGALPVFTPPPLPPTATPMPTSPSTSSPTPTSPPVPTSTPSM